jgi:hypothetical protein
MLQSGGKLDCNRSIFRDKRLDKRMNKIITELSEKPHASISQVFENQYQAKACYRFWDNDKVDPGSILLPSIEQTMESAVNHDIILLAQDTTGLDFTNLKATTGLGYLESKYQQGIKVHTAIAISIDGLPFGLAWQRQWERDISELGKKKFRHQKPTQDKESQRWIDCLNDTNKLFPSDKTLVHITDREGDIYDFLSAARTENQHLLLRFAQDRRIEGDQGRIKSALEEVPVAGTFKTQIGRRGSEYPKEIKLSVKFLEVSIKSPAGASNAKEYPTIRMTAIHVQEVDADPESAIQWYLLTTLPVKSIDDAKTCVKYYTYRWLIERFHYTLKSGCQIEELQLEKSERLENAAATFSVVAWRILFMTYLARLEPNLDARIVFTEDEISALKLKNAVNASSAPVTIFTAMVWVACLGGFLGRKRDGMPGVKTIWRGLYALEFLVMGYNMARKEFANLSKNDFEISTSPSHALTYG